MLNLFWCVLSFLFFFFLGVRGGVRADGVRVGGGGAQAWRLGFRCKEREAISNTSKFSYSAS